MKTTALTPYSIIDIRLKIIQAFSEVQEHFDGSQHHSFVGVVQTIVQEILWIKNKETFLYKNV